MSSELYYWWLSQDDYEKRGVMTIAWLLPEKVRDEVRDRSGRPGRFRLWVPKGVADPDIPQERFKNSGLMDGPDRGGIVVTSEDMPPVLVAESLFGIGILTNAYLRKVNFDCSFGCGHDLAAHGSHGCSECECTAMSGYGIPFSERPIMNRGECVAP